MPVSRTGKKPDASIRLLYSIDPRLLVFCLIDELREIYIVSQVRKKPSPVGLTSVYCHCLTGAVLEVMPMKGLYDLITTRALDSIPGNHAAQLRLFIFSSGPKTMAG